MPISHIILMIIFSFGFGYSISQSISKKESAWPEFIFYCIIWALVLIGDSKYF